MSFINVWNRITLFSNNKESFAGNGIHPPERLRRIIEREKARCDRNAHVFTVVFFEIEGGYIKNNKANHVRDTIINRLRLTDDVGLYDDTRIGVVLPDTPVEGADKLANDINRQVAASGLKTLRYTIYKYPFNSSNGTGGNSDGGSFIKERKFKSLGDSKEKEAPKNGDALLEAYQNSNSGTKSRSKERLLSFRNHKNCTCIAKDLKTICYHPMPSWKRIMDIKCAIIMFILLFPLFIFTALLIKLKSKGPIFLKQKRIGLSRKAFTLWKFRTMNVNVNTELHRRYVKDLIKGDPNDGSEKPMKKLDPSDPNIIPFGIFLRRTHIDELPQLFNVIRGDMSLVGPRPCLDYEYEEYSLWHTKRFDAVPGITGLWQVDGNNDTKFRQMILLDIKYLKEMSFWQDLKILMKTVPLILGRIYR